MLNNKWVVIALLCFVQLSIFVFVANSAAQDFQATGCSADDIQSAIDSAIASGGGTVTIPACEAFGTWQSGDRITATAHGSTDLRVIGQGPDKTKIGYADGQQRGGMFYFRGPGLREFGGMHIKGDGYSGSSGRMAIRLHGVENARIHHIVTEDFAGPTGSLCAGKNNVIDHCTFGDVQFPSTYHWYIYGDNNYLTDWTPNYGTTNYNVFFEDCVFKNSHHPVALFTAGSAVLRHNTFSFVANSGYSNLIDCHSCCFGDCGGDDEPYNWDFDIDRAGRAYEIYNNTMEWTGPGRKTYFARIRAGSVLFTGNNISVVSPEGEIRQAIQLVCENNNNGPRCTSEYGFPVDYTYSNGCNGPTDGCCDKIETSYVWGNILGPKVRYEMSAGQICGSGSLVEDRDYFLRAPTMAQDGFEWTPYEYPHPLVTCGSVKPPTPTNLRVVR